MAGELAILLDEIALEERDLVLLENNPPDMLVAHWLGRLSALVPEEHADHWMITLAFMRGVFEAWQSWLTAQGLLDIGMRRVQALRAQTRQWREFPPEFPVIAAGIGAGGTIPAAAELLRVIAEAPNGSVVLHGASLATDAALWDAIAAAPTHPLSGQQRLLMQLGAREGDIRPWKALANTSVPETRPELLSMALRPAGSLSAWQEREPARWTAGLVGISLLVAPDAQAEAVAIALTIRGALEKKDTRAALVTPDRDLARRVSAELARFGIVADDSAGAPLAATPSGAFLRLLARAVAEDLAPVPLLAVLKHPLCCGGMDRTDWMASVRRLDWHALRGPRPAPGIAGLRAAVVEAASRPGRRAEQAAEGMKAVDALEACLGRFQGLRDGVAVAPGVLLADHLAAAEALAATATRPGGIRLYDSEEGEVLARHLADLQAALADADPVPASSWPALFDAAMAGAAAPALHGSRGRAGAPHPRVEILGLLEARLLGHELVVLGALDETVWPLATDPGPWLSRPMRRDFGLPEPEARIGRVAADFLLGACGAREVVFSRAERRGGAPTVKARWLTRLETFLSGQCDDSYPDGLAIPRSPASSWAAALDAPEEVVPCRRPAPSPPIERRPKSISVTAIETLIADPYAFYARRVLGLEKLDDLDAVIGAADYGTLVHDVMHLFVPFLLPWPGRAAARVRFDAAVDEVLQREGVRPGFAAFWRPRLRRIGDFVLDQEEAMRVGVEPDDVIMASHVECDGKLQVTLDDGASVELRGRADRIDALASGELRILDYKTGTLPSQIAVRVGEKPQLTLEAAMAARGAFHRSGEPSSPQAGDSAALVYWRLTGGPEKGKPLAAIEGRDAVMQAAEEALENFRVLASEFLFGNRPFTARPHPGRAPAGSEYDHLSRIAEWGTSDEGDEA